MIPEQLIYNFIRSRKAIMTRIENQVYLGEAPEGTSGGYIVISAILPGRVGEVGAYFPRVQISCFEVGYLKLLQLADLVVEETDGYTGSMGSVYTNSCLSERLKPVRTEGGTQMCPVEIRFTYLKEG